MNVIMVLVVGDSSVVVVVSFFLSLSTLVYIISFASYVVERFQLQNALFDVQFKIFKLLFLMVLYTFSHKECTHEA